MALFLFMAIQYLEVFDSKIGTTYTLEVLIVLTVVVVANILILSVANMLRALHTIYSKIRAKLRVKEKRTGTIDKIVHYSTSLNAMWFWLVVAGIFPLSFSNVDTWEPNTRSTLRLTARLYFDAVFLGFAAELMILAVSLRRVYVRACAFVACLAYVRAW
jgi:hypothetical protein